MFNWAVSLIQNFGNRFGYKVTKIDDINRDFEPIFVKCKSFTMTSKERMHALYNAVKYVIKYNIPGDFVECGVWKGGSAMVIAYALLEAGVKDRKIFLYDTFEGMSMPSDVDCPVSGGSKAVSEWKKKQKSSHNEWCFSSIDEVESHMVSTGYPKENLVFVKGKVEDSIPDKVPDKICLLRLDTDWYESTKHELIHLFPLLVKNGVLILDDYGCWAGSKKATDEFFSKRPILLNRIDYAGRIGIKSDEFGK